MNAAMAPDRTPIGAAVHTAVSELDLAALANHPVKLWASWALKCSRWVGFRLLDIPPDIVDDWDPAKREAGNAIDRAVKALLVEQFGAEVDVRFTLMPDLALEGEGDAILPTTPKGSAAVEIKSTSLKKLNGVLGNWRNTAAGPEHAWVVQAAWLAIARRLDAVHLIVVAQDDLGHAPAEWLIPMHDAVANLEGRTPTQLALREANRLRAILAVSEQGTLPAREIPGYGMVEYPPPSGDAGDPWQCRFCTYQPTCAKQPTGEVPNFGKRVAA